MLAQLPCIVLEMETAIYKTQKFEISLLKLPECVRGLGETG